jgi:hypothetical protein
MVAKKSESEDTGPTGPKLIIFLEGERGIFADIHALVAI